jgi:glutamine amidotransferase
VIALVDYGAGNLTSVRKAFAAAGADVFVPTSPADLAPADAVVIPGVGHFSATRALDERWREAILERVGEGRPLLGICLGMQWLFEESEEEPDIAGLGLFAGRCFRLREATSGTGGRMKVPHVGWNDIGSTRESRIAAGIEFPTQVYFTHSFAAPVSADAVAIAHHGQDFAAIVERGHVAGVQFHPEKSGDAGLRMLRNFVELAGSAR